LGRLTTHRNKLFIAILCFHFIGFAQIKHDQISIDSEVFKKENSQLIINSNVLLAGESLLYKVYNFNDSKQLSALSKIMYISLRNEKDSIIFNHKLPLKDGTASGSLFFPANLKTGTYKLVGYTIFSLNNNDNAISQKSIYIINPFSKSHINNLTESNKNNTVKLRYTGDSTTNTLNASKNILLKTDKLNYQKREKIKLSISILKSELNFGNYALSVRKVSAISVIDPISKHKNLATENDKIFYIPEVRGEIISGKILTSHSDLKVSNQQVALSLKGEKYILKTAITNSTGQFFISIDEPYQTENCILQILGANKDKFSIVMDDKKFHFVNNDMFSNIHLNLNLKDYLQERSIQIQLLNAYFNPNNIKTKEVIAYQPFYGTIGNKYILDDYTRFSTFKETCVEIVTTIKTKEKDDTVSIEVFDPFSGYKISPFSTAEPLIIIDGIVAQDHMEVYRYNTKNIESIQVFSRPYRFGPSVFHGIIDIKTKKGDYKPMLSESSFVEFKLESLASMNAPFIPNYSTDSLDRIPDYRVQLYWNPNMDVNSNEIVKEFYSSDVVGAYEVVVEGYSIDGEHIVSKYNFNVE
jgi:hypothetical protein